MPRIIRGCDSALKNTFLSNTITKPPKLNLKIRNTRVYCIFFSQYWNFVGHVIAMLWQIQIQINETTIQFSIKFFRTILLDIARKYPATAIAYKSYPVLNGFSNMQCAINLLFKTNIIKTSILSFRNWSFKKYFFF